jgi:predicted phage terminase large subunit-like protein
MGIRRATRDTFNYIFTHVRKGQWGTDQVEAEIHKHAIADAMRLGNETYFVGVEREPGSGGVFSVDATKRRLREFKVRAIRATKDKLVTAEPLAVAVGFGEVYCVDDPEWTADFIQELTDAPGGQFMDQFDAAAKAVVLANDEIGKQKRRAILSGDQVVDLCLSGCGRPVAENSDYCCSSCEQVAAFGDPDMQADHDANCIQRYFNYQNRG